jgi:chromosome partitioning protein
MASNDSGGVGFDVVPANISSLRRPCEEGAWEFVDAPPSGRILETAIASADFVVVPTSDSPMDLQQAWSTLDAIHGSRPAAVLIVRAERGTRAYVETVQALDSAGTPRFESVVFKRQEIKKSIGERPEKLFEYAEVFAELRRELHEG